MYQKGSFYGFMNKARMIKTESEETIYVFPLVKCDSTVEAQTGLWPIMKHNKT